MTFVDTTNWPVCDVCHKKHDVVFMGTWVKDPDLEISRIHHPWEFPDRERNMRRFDLFPRWTVFRSRMSGYRWRVVGAWTVLKGGEWHA